MAIEADLRSYLLDDEDLVDLVGQRLYPQAMPQGAAFPAIVYRRSNQDRDHTQDGATGLCQTIFELRCLGELAAAAESVFNRVRDLCDGFYGEIGETKIRGMFLTGGDTSYLPPDTADEKGVFISRAELTVWHDESIPALAD